MVDLFTPLDRLRLPEVGAKLDLWAPPVIDGLNDGVADLLDEMLGADVTINLAGGDVTLSPLNGITDDTRPQSLTLFNNTGGARNCIVPDPQTSKLYFIQASFVGTMQFKTVSGVGVNIPAFTDSFVYVDAANDTCEIIDFVGDLVSLLQPSSIGAGILCDIEDATAGDTQVTIGYYVQGNLVFVRIPTFSSTITPGGVWNRVRLLPNTPASFVGLIDATIAHVENGYCLVGGVSEPFSLSYPRFSVDQIDIMQSDPGSLAANGAVLALPYAFHATYVADNTNVVGP